MDHYFDIVASNGIARLWGALVQQYPGGPQFHLRILWFLATYLSVFRIGIFFSCVKFFWPRTRGPPGARGPGSLNRLNSRFLHYWLQGSEVKLHWTDGSTVLLMFNGLIGWFGKTVLLLMYLSSFWLWQCWPYYSSSLFQTQKCTVLQDFAWKICANISCCYPWSSHQC